MTRIEFNVGSLPSNYQNLVSRGFEHHSTVQSAPLYERERVYWLAYHAEQEIAGVLTADNLWSWLYIDELWVAEEFRGKGIGIRLMQNAEHYASNHGLVGLWLWTQSWQAEEFYKKMGYVEFTRFQHFPKGYERIGFRKYLDDSTIAKYDGSKVTS